MLSAAVVASRSLGLLSMDGVKGSVEPLSSCPAFPAIHYNLLQLIASPMLLQISSEKVLKTLIDDTNHALLQDASLERKEGR